MDKNAERNHSSEHYPTFVYNNIQKLNLKTKWKRFLLIDIGAIVQNSIYKN